ncbi:MAG: phosphate/phosphite/phosphonate ABC transporter substrate-binding protein [Ardenticatenales bacterium]|nr:phosphate/phosphite/phosphonate ABC transporter substrate-binding protein [Ardenticatenales bacterium]
MPRSSLTFILLLACLFLLGCASTATSPTAQSSTPSNTQSVIVLAEISDDPGETVSLFLPLAEYLTANLDQLGVTKVEIKVAPDLEAMTQWMESGEVDVYFDSVYPALIVSQNGNGEPILRRWKGGVSEYNTVFLTRADSGITTLGDLEGRTLAFSEPYSTSGYMLPLVKLLESGFTPVENLRSNSPVPDDKIGYVFAYDDDLIIEWVLEGRVTAGAIDSTRFQKLTAEQRSQVSIIAETKSVPRQVAVVNSNMTPDLKEAIRVLLLELDETEEGRAILAAFDETAQFDEFPGGTTQALAEMRAMFEIMQAFAQR